MWADKESRLNLADRTFTYINLRVQPKGVGLAIYGLITVIPQSTNRTVFKNRTAMRSCKKSQETQAYGVGAAALVPMKLLQHAQSNLTAREKLAHYCGVSVDLVTFREKVTGVKLG